jgi:hypothetical protein
MIHIHLLQLWGYFSIIFSILLPAMSKTLYTSVLKFSVSTSWHSTGTLFQFVIVLKMASMYFILYRGKQAVVGGCGSCCEWVEEGTKARPIFALRVRKLVWGLALSWRRRTSLMFQVGQTVRMRRRSLFTVSLHRSWCIRNSEFVKNAIRR